ncbi:DNA cytosine methyltransferase [Goodfellowiella coeruleoviolacea]|uniref:DNA (cytosine-5-)-methyltransferase n=1 Tax=Goodfellowiella coeruleoviolacea TaxID=334858 RepID=A0AAE3KNW7_9PSEU|nr:DNA cytosine methyltransferase [Goodfellowiella coeruleoviolacea]MCP2169148.1 DNA (cytosine-5)-methyltransferase 1 [Goodfellowiella coeruleoviolacea]
MELFAGGGGLAMAVHRSGFRPLLLNEFVKYACDTLEANGAVPRGDDERIPEPGERTPLARGDVRQLKMGYLEGMVDLLAGGPPCQPFSLGGVAKGDEDKRNMFPEMFRAIREIKPKAFICENVRGLLRPSFKPYFDYIIRELMFPFEERDPEATWLQHDAILKGKEERGDAKAAERYRVFTFPVNAADYGVPQIRNRVVIVGFRGDLDIDEELLRAATKPTHSKQALLRSMASGEYWDRHNSVVGRAKVPPHVIRHVMGEVQAALPFEEAAEGLKPWRTLRDALAGDDGADPLPDVPWNRLDRKQYDDMPKEHIGWPDARIYPGHTPNVLDRPAKTVKAGVHGVPGGESVMLTDTLVKGTGKSREYRHRYMTVRETARVMTFPDEWVLCGPRGEQMRQLGNAVPVLLGEVFAKAVATVLGDAEKRL